MATQPVECAICDKLFTTYGHLAQHCVNDHQGFKLVDDGFRMHLTKRKRVACWCGRNFKHGTPIMAPAFMEGYVYESNWAKHLEKKGGMAAHFLELILLHRE